jgi:hypothetical protein
MRCVFISLTAWALVGSPNAQAQNNWFDQIFPEKSHNFGTVARGSQLRHAFRLVNTTSYDIHIADWRTKCGCTDIKVGARDIPPGTQTTIEATLDTTKFQGYKASGLTLVLDRPYFVEVDLNLVCFIRGDVMLVPGQVDFQAVPRGTKPTATLNLTYLGGRPDWDITKVQTIGPQVTAELRKLGRNAGGALQYQLTATLDSTAPSGYFKDEITLLTNDRESPSIPVSVTANVLAAVSVAPAVVNLGRMRPGAIVKRTVMVKASKPFKVTEVMPQKPDLKASKTFDDAKPFHTLTVEFKAPTQPGPYNAVVEITTDLPNEPPAKFTAFATIVP